MYIYLESSQLFRKIAANQNGRANYWHVPSAPYNVHSRTTGSRRRILMDEDRPELDMSQHAERSVRSVGADNH